MASILPTVPRFVLTIFEPLSLLAGAVAPFLSTDWFVAKQLPLSALEPLSANSRMVALQLGNIYLLLAMVGIAVLYTTTEPRVVRNYVIALLIADVGHVAVTCWVMDYESLTDIANWNAMAWGNIGVTAFLFSVRTSYLLGLFGDDHLPTTAIKKSN